MRRRGGLLLAIGMAAVLAAAAPAPSQDTGADPYFWPHRTFYIPVNVARLNSQSDGKPPSDLQLYSSLNRGAWQAGPKLAANKLQDLGDGKKGFQFTSDKDGEYEFSVRYWYADGASSPAKVDELQKMLTVTIDTTVPVVRLVAGANGVEWAATDDNLDGRKVELQCKFPHWTEWKTLSDRPFKPADSYAWKLQPGQVLDVRVLAKDKAGNEGFSPVVRVPGDGAAGGGLPRPGGSSDWPPGGATSMLRDPATPGGAAAPRARIEYVNKEEITVDYTIQRIGRSGIKAARLYVLRDTDSSGWKADGEFKVNLQPSDKDQTLSLKYTPKDEGVYGFYVAPESGAGVKADPPRKDDPPMMYVVIDRKAPFVKITGVRVTPGGVRGPLVEITWEAGDQNLMANPVSLEYSVDKNAAQWNEVKYRLENNLTTTTGRYVWEMPDADLWKFYVRVRAVDKAGNSNQFVWPDEVIVDLEKPQAGITGVRGTGAGGGGGGTTPSPEPTPKPVVKPAPTSTPAPVEPATPAPATKPMTPAPSSVPSPPVPEGSPPLPALPPLPGA